MPQDIESKLTWLFLLFPGFLSMAIIGQIVDLGQLTEFQITFYSFVLTLVDISVAFFVCWLMGLLSRLCSRLFKKSRKAEFSKKVFYVLVFLCSISTGLLIGFAGEKDWFFITLRALPITDTLNKRSSSRPLVFLLSQNSAGQLKEDGDARPPPFEKTTEAWVRVYMKGGKQYEGWPEYFGIGDQATELYLSPACELRSRFGKETLKPIKGPGILIFEREIEALMFIDREESDCYAYWFNEKNQAPKQDQ